MIRLVVYSGYGADAMTKGMKDVINQNNSLGFVEMRMKLAEYIESRVGCLSDMLSSDMEAMKTWFKSQPEMFIKVSEKSENQTVYACWDCDEQRIKTLSVVNVDDTQRWGIVEYDGAEGVKYFKEPEMLDGKYNYFKW